MFPLLHLPVYCSGSSWAAFVTTHDPRDTVVSAVTRAPRIMHKLDLCFTVPETLLCSVSPPQLTRRTYKHIILRFYLWADTQCTILQFELLVLRYCQLSTFLTTQLEQQPNKTFYATVSFLQKKQWIQKDNILLLTCIRTYNIKWAVRKLH